MGLVKEIQSSDVTIILKNNNIMYVFCTLTEKMKNVSRIYLNKPFPLICIIYNMVKLRQSKKFYFQNPIRQIRMNEYSKIAEETKFSSA